MKRYEITGLSGMRNGNGTQTPMHVMNKQHQNSDTSNARHSNVDDLSDFSDAFFIESWIALFDEVSLLITFPYFSVFIYSTGYVNPEFWTGAYNA